MKVLSLVVVLCACGAASSKDAGPPTTSGETFGTTHTGSYHLGPVDWAQSAFENSCGPYPAAIQALEGEYLAGIDRSLNGDGSLCDACALLTTRLGKSVLVRIITTGTSKSAGDMDLSPAAYGAIHEDDPQGTNTNPRPMTWKLALCPTSTEKILLQYQTEANPYWTSLWVRNARLPLSKVEMKSAQGANFVALRRENDGTWNADKGFGEGMFTLRFTSTTGKELTKMFTSLQGGQLVTTDIQFD